MLAAGWTALYSGLKSWRAFFIVSAHRLYTKYRLNPIEKCQFSPPPPGGKGVHSCPWRVHLQLTPKLSPKKYFSPWRVHLHPVSTATPGYAYVSHVHWNRICMTRSEAHGDLFVWDAVQDSSYLLLAQISSVRSSCCHCCHSITSPQGYLISAGRNVSLASVVAVTGTTTAKTAMVE